MVAGLGNPDERYRATLHNLGFAVADALAGLPPEVALGVRPAGRRDPRPRWRDRSGGLACEIAVAGRRVLLVKPQTYMNLSGEAVRPAADWWKIPVDRTIVVHDDMDLEPGVVRVKVGGGSGGHRGIDSCIRHLGSREFVRVRLGIGKHPRMPGERWVLSRIPSEMHEILAEAVVDARRAVELIVERGAALAMNETNRRTEETGS